MKSEVRRSSAAKMIYTGLGLLFAGLAIAGAFLPLVPVTINVIVSGFFLARGSERFDNWLTNHRLFGPIIYDHRNGIGFTKRAKSVALSAMSLSIFASTWWALSQGAPPLVGYFMAGIWVWATWFILKQPTKPVAVLSSANMAQPAEAQET